VPETPEAFWERVHDARRDAGGRGVGDVAVPDEI
jgi:hypothetical protein